MAETKSRNALDGDIIKLRRGLAIFKVNKSPYYRVRMLDPRTKKYSTRSTKEVSRIEARTTAEELYELFIGNPSALIVSKAKTFEGVADRLIERELERGKRGEVHKRLYANTAFYLKHKEWGACRFFANRDVATVTTKDYNAYIEFVRDRAPELKPASMNHISSALSKVFRLARDSGLLEAVPATARVRRKDNPRPYFRFQPLVEPEQDEYRALLRTARQMAAENVKIRETVITMELYEMIVFLTQSFLRPTESELYAVRHCDIQVIKDPRSLQITIDKGKTGNRISSTLSECVNIYEHICQRQGDHKPDDYLFLPEYQNRASAKRIAQRIFNALLDKAGLKDDVRARTSHSLYSLRHTAICMRLVKSKGEVNIYTLAKNAGTSVSQIERFYARALPISGDLVRNLQTFGKDG